MHAAANINECAAEYQVGPDSVIPGLATNSLAGTRTGSASPASSCALISWHTDYDHYRGGHGRTYLPGVPISDTTALTITSTYQALVLGHATAWRTAINAYAGAPFTALVYSRVSRFRDKQVLDPPVLRAIKSESVRLGLATQRRRLT
jgi:hypothetical protein